MNKTNSIIEVNGNRYDAVSGQLLNTVRKTKNHAQTSTKTVIDGFVLGSHHTKKTIKRSVSLAQPSKKRTKTVSQGLHRPPQRTSTLMRHVVKKPRPLPKNTSSVPPKARQNHVNHIKEFRAKTAVKHAAVNRFGHFPQPKGQTHGVAAPTGVKTIKGEVMSSSPRLPSMVTSVSHRKLEQMLDEGLAKADAHKQMMNALPKPSRLNKVRSGPRWLRFAVIALFLVFLAFFLIWQNLPSVAVRVAAAKAHVDAVMPSYTPTGFAYSGHVQYVPGAVTMEFKDRNDSNQTFSLTQKASNWSSASLEANALPKDGTVQTSEVNGTEVYIYGDSNNATWVNRNVLYQLENKANLSSDQVLKIVQGL